MMAHWLMAMLVSLFLWSCSWGDAEPIVDVVHDVRQVDQCVEFQAAKDRVHQRLKEISTEDLHRLAEINMGGRILCTVSITDLIDQLDEIQETLP